MTINNLNQYEDIAVDMQDNHVKTYIQFKMLHLETFKKEINNIKSFLVKEHIPDNYKKFLYKLYRYEKKHQYKYKKNGYKAVAGIRIEILLPKKIKNESDQKKFARAYMNQCNPLHYSLPWISYIIQRKDSNYLVLLISEREFIDAEEAETYNRNYKSKEGILLHKRGDPKLDKNGNPKKVHVLFSKKVRIFTFSKFKCFEKFIQDLVEKLMIVLNSTIVKVEKRFTMKKKNAKKLWHFYNGKCVIEINHTKRFIESMCNMAIVLQRQKVQGSVYEKYRLKAPPTPLIKEISKVFYKYKKRFDKDSFHDKHNELCKIGYKNVSLDVLQENLNILMDEFKQELKEIVPAVFN